MPRKQQVLLNLNFIGIAMQVETSCPLGHTCEKAENNVIYRCGWYTKVKGTDSNSGDEVEEWRCAMNWLPALIIENSGNVRLGVASMDKVANEVVKTREATIPPLLSQDMMQQLLTKNS